MARVNPSLPQYFRNHCFRCDFPDSGLLHLHPGYDVVSSLITARSSDELLLVFQKC